MHDLLDLQTFLKSVQYHGCNAAEQAEYIQAHLTRTVETFRLIEELHPSADQTVLDIGAKPYMLAALVKKFTPATFIGVGYSIDDVRDAQSADQRSMAGKAGSVPVRSAPVTLSGGSETLPITMWQVNVETDQLPFEDNSIDIVVFSEILEHLIFNPSLAIAEINRVLKPGGTLILSTPNQLYWVRILRMLLGRNIDDPYSIHGPYGRHNRNYTVKEINTLCSLHGLTRTWWTTETFMPLSSSSLQRMVVNTANKLLALIPSRKGKTFIGTFVKTAHHPKPEYPAWLYH